MVHSQFVDLGNLFEVAVHHHVIERMTNLGCQDGAPMMNTLVCMVTHWIRLTIGHDIKQSGNHDFTKSIYYIVSQP